MHWRLESKFHNLVFICFPVPLLGDRMYSLNFTLDSFQEKGFIAFGHIFIRLWFPQLIFHLLWLDIIFTFPGGLQHRLRAPIRDPLRRIFANPPTCQMCGADGLFLGSRRLLRSLIGHHRHDHCWLEVAFGLELFA